jgi:hypothetical protein
MQTRIRTPAPFDRANGTTDARITGREPEAIDPNNLIDGADLKARRLQTSS